MMEENDRADRQKDVRIDGRISGRMDRRWDGQRSDEQTDLTDLHCVICMYTKAKMQQKGLPGPELSLVLFGKKVVVSLPRSFSID